MRAHHQSPRSRQQQVMSLLLPVQPLQHLSPWLAGIPAGSSAATTSSYQAQRARFASQTSPAGCLSVRSTRSRLVMSRSQKELSLLALGYYQQIECRT